MAGGCPKWISWRTDRSQPDNEHLVGVVMLEDDTCGLACLVCCRDAQVDHNLNAAESYSGS